LVASGVLVHRTEVRSGRLQIRKIQLLDFRDFAPQYLHSLPDAPIHKGGLYLRPGRFDVEHSRFRTVWYDVHDE